MSVTFIPQLNNLADKMKVYWEERLTKEEINSILAYLITLFPWEEYE
ncbi:MAG: hypothetical protein IIB95_03900 [Candidatus Marinimicrobia bacterium]|nr:hypothetical protein [Candidatus Neomarinimicrobiota bacterium]MCH7762868.1 hypothetical protein [Candidatus Neomarinimicrobiota bacterium]